jgi:nucleoside-diphosphate-sugar epimerase
LEDSMSSEQIIAPEVLVTGGRGKTGREVVAQLAARSVPVRAGSRAPGKGVGTIRPVVFDWDDPATCGIRRRDVPRVRRAIVNEPRASDRGAISAVARLA